jgi:FkbM family methyltransferase
MSRRNEILSNLYTLIPGSDPIKLVDYYSEFLDYYPECELQTKRWFVENVEPDWVIVDVGANIGYYSILFARLAKQGRVIACEPTATVKKLKNNLDANGCHNVEIKNTALGHSTGTYTDDIYRIWGHKPERQEYDFVTLDQLVDDLGLQRLDCIKIDTDGFEFDILRGAERTLSRFNPWVVIEINHALATRGHSAHQVLEWLSGRGYKHGLVLDKENVVLRRDQSDADVRAEFQLRFEQRPIILASRFAKSALIPSYFEGMETIAPVTTLPVPKKDVLLKAEAILPQWHYMAYCLKAPGAPNRTNPIVISCLIEVEEGEVGIGCVDSGGSKYICKEIYSSASDVLQEVEILVEQPESISKLIFRNAAATNTKTKFTLHSINVFDAFPAAPQLDSPYMNSKVRSLSVQDCAGLLGDALSHLETPNLPTPFISVIEVDQIRTTLGFRGDFFSPHKLIPIPPGQFKMEVHDAPILKYIYSQLKPRRHLEFGTWEGFGVTLCASSCDAEIWTINLPEGELDQTGSAIYSQLIDRNGAGNEQDQEWIQTDAGTNIGWRYRAAGFSDRVHQILIDSREWDSSVFGRESFDSVLIDGGHTPDVVANDTNKSIPLLRSGGLMVWHDFCPDREALSRQKAPQGVMRAIIENGTFWRQQFSGIYWIRPSMILVGRKK